MKDVESSQDYDKKQKTLLNSINMPLNPNKYGLIYY